MLEESIWYQLETARHITLRWIAKMTEEVCDVQPEGFPNNFRWHLGHIATIQAQLAHYYIGLPLMLPDGYPERFANGTRPSEWMTPGPALPELAEVLAGQIPSLRAALPDGLAVPAVKTFERVGRRMETAADILLFSAYHEGLHIGMINGIKYGMGGGKR
ncbi:DinB family protein [Paenibacillus gansuensis]|uniref:DinB family protein n=1 Tax=Paenibacillus gansuensis TaxID=306542 RepID=A0ABW5PBW4_9BACL